MFNRAKVEMIRTVIGGVDGRLFRADVVRPDRITGMLSTLGDKSTPGKKIDKRWKIRFQAFN